MKIPFSKMHGIGNNYIYLDLFQTSYPEEVFSPLAIAISNVHTGVGSDGLILIHPSDLADVGMRIFNKDGSEGQSCGNGLRCVAKYAYENNLVMNKVLLIETKAGVVTAEVFGDRDNVNIVTVDMGLPLLLRSSVPMVGNEDDQVISESFRMGPHRLEVTALFLGNPHAVFFVDCIDNAPLYELGPLIMDDSRFPNRTNVEFVEVLSSHELNFRVWERGSGVTEACGSGACAAVVAAILNGYCRRNEDITVHLSGGDLTIKWADDEHVWMTGAAQLTMEGVFHFLSAENSNL